ncbi:NAD(P)H-binding protein [Paenibacillus sp. FSL R5-0623]|uniref:NAD(P)H-binding protein n=1 Tax=Paenibacillus sp. FSL R5-0623 TaxID=2921651 RepID=UPI0030D86AD8
MDNKNITVFDCTGKTRREIVRQALERGHFVTAYARNPQKLEMTHPNLNVVKGELYDLGVRGIFIGFMYIFKTMINAM